MYLVQKWRCAALSEAVEKSFNWRDWQDSPRRDGKLWDIVGGGLMNCHNVRYKSECFDGLYEIERTLLKENFVDTPRGPFSPNKWSSPLFQFAVVFLRLREMLSYGSYGGWRERSEIACRQCLYRRQTMASVEFALFHQLSARKCIAVALVCTYHYFDNRIWQYSGFVSKY